MNFLVYDDPPAISHLVRSALAARAHRASIATDIDDAMLKLDTGLFDAVIVGPSGAPLELADHLESQWAALPLILAGMENAIPCDGRLVAVLTRPLSLRALADAIRRAESVVHRADAGRLLNLVLDGQHRECRVLRRSAGHLLVEAPAGCPRPRSDEAVLGPGAIDLPARVIFADDGSRMFALETDDAGLERVLADGGVA